MNWNIFIVIKKFPLKESDFHNDINFPFGGLWFNIRNLPKPKIRYCNILDSLQVVDYEVFAS